MKLKIAKKLKIKSSKVKKTKKRVIIGCILSFIFVFIVLGVDFYIGFSSKSLIYKDINKIPAKKAALVLGTSKFDKYGEPNYFYDYRLDAAAKLFKARKVKAIIVSGDNSIKGYNEPEQMKNDLKQKGVPGNYITLDYAGFRTLDAIIRAQRVFGQDQFTIISQNFHNERAIFIARNNNIKAIGFNAAAASFPNHLRVRLREVFARTKVFLDIYVLNTQPKFLGKKIDIK